MVAYHKQSQETTIKSHYAFSLSKTRIRGTPKYSPGWLTKLRYRSTTEISFDFDQGSHSAMGSSSDRIRYLNSFQIL